MSNTGLRGHKLKIYKPQVHLGIRKYFFSIRVIGEWLPVELINCNTVESFKKRIDCYFRNRGYIYIYIYKLALSFFSRVSHLRVATG